MWISTSTNEYSYSYLDFICIGFFYYGRGTERLMTYSNFRSKTQKITSKEDVLFLKIHGDKFWEILYLTDNRLHVESISNRTAVS